MLILNIQEQLLLHSSTEFPNIFLEFLFSHFFLFYFLFFSFSFFFFCRTSLWEWSWVILLLILRVLIIRKFFFDEQKMNKKKFFFYKLIAASLAFKLQERIHWFSYQKSKNINNFIILLKIKVWSFFFLLQFFCDALVWGA